MFDLLSYLTWIDLYGVNIQLNYKNKTHHKTLIGSIVSISMFILVYCLFSEYLTETEKRPFLSYQKKQMGSNDSMTLENIPIAVSLTARGSPLPLEHPSLSSLFRVRTINKNKKINNPEKLGDLSFKNCDDIMSEEAKTLFYQASIPIKFTHCLLPNTIVNSEKSNIGLAINMQILNEIPSSSYLRNQFYINVHYIDDDFDPYSEIKFKKVVKTHSFLFENQHLDVHHFKIKTTELLKEEGYFSKKQTIYRGNQIQYDPYDKSSLSTIVFNYDFFLMFYFTTTKDCYCLDYQGITQLFSMLGGLYYLTYFLGLVLFKGLSEINLFLQESKDLINYNYIPACSELGEFSLSSDNFYAQNVSLTINRVSPAAKCLTPQVLNERILNSDSKRDQSIILQQLSIHQSEKVKKENISLLCFIRSCLLSKFNSKHKSYYKLYEALIHRFKSHHSIEKLIKTENDVEILKKLFFGSRPDFQKIFQGKIPLGTALQEVEQSREQNNINCEDANETELRNVEQTLDSMILNLSKKSLFEDNRDL